MLKTPGRVSPILAIVAILALMSGAAVAQTVLPSGKENPIMWVQNAGVTPGEYLRFSFFNPHHAQDGLSKTIILTERGDTVFDSGEFVVPPLQTVFFDLDGDSRALDELRDARGRVQVAAIAIPNVLGARQAANGAVVAGLELVDGASGRTTTISLFNFSLSNVPLLGNIAIGTTLVPPAASRRVAEEETFWAEVMQPMSSVGVSSGDLLRLTAFNPRPANREQVTFTLFAPDGTPVQAFGPFDVPPLQTVYVDLSGDDRTLDPFREANGRVQLAVTVEVPGAIPPARGRPRGPALVTGAELVDEATGQTRTQVDHPDFSWLPVFNPRRQGSERF
jgi:hypothetical protein